MAALELEKFQNKDGTLSARKIRRSLGSRRNRRDGTKACRTPFSKRTMKLKASTEISLRRRALMKIWIDKITPKPIVVVEEAVVA